MESGIYWGYISLIEGLIERIKTSHECFNAKAIATGGWSKLFENDLKCINY
jgi:Putative transcriptional regulator, homolog of Bvg accessory factor